MRLFTAAAVDEIAVLDPIFNLGPTAQRTLGLLTCAGYTGRLSLQCRFEALSDAFFEHLDGLDAHLEFGLQTIHDAEARVIDRRNRLEQVGLGIDQLQRRGIPFMVSLIYGLPLQTLASFRASVQFCLDRGVPVIRAFPLMLLRGTPLEHRRHEWALRESHDVIPSVISSSTFTEDEWRVMAEISAGLRETEGRHPLRVEDLE